MGHVIDGYGCGHKCSVSMGHAVAAVATHRLSLSPLIWQGRSALLTRVDNVSELAISGDAPFVLAHLSDVHLGPLPRLPLALANAKRLAGTLNWYRNRRHVHRPEAAEAVARDVVEQSPDHIAVTGDLTNIGLPEEIARSAAWLGRLGAAVHVSVIPGNHDIYSTVRGRRLGVAALAPWAPHFASCDLGRQLQGPEAFPFVRA